MQRQRKDEKDLLLKFELYFPFSSLPHPVSIAVVPVSRILATTRTHTNPIYLSISPSPSIHVAKFLEAMGIKCQLESNINIIHNNNNTNRKQTKCSTNISNRICSDKSHFYKVSQAWIRIELNLFYSFQMKETEEEAEREREEPHNPLRFRPHSINHPLWSPHSAPSFRIHSLETAAWATWVSAHNLLLHLFAVFGVEIQLNVPVSLSNPNERIPCSKHPSPSMHPSIDRYWITECVYS